MKKFWKKEETTDLELVEKDEESTEEEVTEKKGFHIPKTALVAGGVGLGLLALFGMSKIGSGSDAEFVDEDNSDSEDSETFDESSEEVETGSETSEE